MGFSYDADLVPHFDDSALGYYRVPPERADLTVGFDVFQSKDEAKDNRLDDLLAALEHGWKKELKRRKSDGGPANDTTTNERDTKRMRTEAQPNDTPRTRGQTSRDIQVQSRTNTLDSNIEPPATRTDTHTKPPDRGNNAEQAIPDSGTTRAQDTADTLQQQHSALHNNNTHSTVESRAERFNTGVDMVMWRGLMSKLFITPYCRNDRFNEPWKFGAMLLDGCIYLCEIKTEQKEMDTRGKMLCYGGFKFEQYCTVADRAEAQRMAREGTRPEIEHTPVNNSIAYCAIFRSKLGKHRVVMGAEMDCLKADGRKWDLGSYVELKTSKVIHSQRDEENFEKTKLLKSWAQSFLSGVETIVYGFRDHQSIVRAVQQFKTREMHRNARAKGYWDPQICISFAQGLLNVVKEVVTEDACDTTYVFELDNATNSVTASADSSAGRFQFFPDGFVERHSTEQHL
ncbi:hypothetical protein SARC_01803 [Sphaeroforma arctica JP610]|uniref:Decapping nuclease n=1 Tax=Sphaeroforma arctica JP610 TaxID=667725 RepID=A0A0L0GAM7_9EUKA|nr:hypothetical protein SARC_01803 [Sphaeroforma arctica JP610]KNC86045.1 hypothetical protein SARC_01803 [Sphaeroforma arctica JP610]|eukprot:XP_014159947.1 hypothetical protein SARC_01803 [Sphaeroforma arctica JP610]